jgi:hypothetical protein
MTSLELTGGAGFTYEDAAAAHYLAAMLGGTTATGLDSRVVQRVAQQQANFGEPLDDVIVDAASVVDQTVMRLSLQVKRSLTISAAATNTDFREVIQRSWQTLQKPDFRESVDRVGAITGSVAEDTSRVFMELCEWARASDTTTTFMQRFAADGNASATHRAVAEAVRAIAGGAGAPISAGNPDVRGPERNARFRRRLATFAVAQLSSTCLSAAPTFMPSLAARFPQRSGVAWYPDLIASARRLLQSERATAFLHCRSI